MNFCVAILILKMEEKSNIFGVLCFITLRKVKTQLKCKRDLEKVLGLMERIEGFVKFCAGDFSLDDALQSGRPVEVDSDQTETLRTINVIPMLYQSTLHHETANIL